MSRQGIWSAQFGIATKSVACQGCLKSIISYDKYKGWEASHITAKASGGSRHLYNLFALCSVCNKKMGTQNMFCFFYDTMNKYALKKLVKYVRMIFKVHYPEVWKQCRGQMWELAHKRYVDTFGGIPKDHDVLKYFMEYDIKKNNKITVEAYEEYQKKKRLADKVNERYTKMYIKRLPKLKRTK